MQISPTKKLIEKSIFQQILLKGLQIDPLPQYSGVRPDPKGPHASVRKINLSIYEKKLALKNALRYFPEHLHKILASEFLSQLNQYGHIYMYRFRPTQYQIRAYPIDYYPAKSVQAKAIIHNIMNNLNAQVAQFPYQLITYGGNGCVFQNWAQYHLTISYLLEMTEQQTLVMASGHPQGLYPSTPINPRVIITNGMMVFNYSKQQDYYKYHALGVTMYGQMTAGSYCYIGSQGIVHGTTLTLQNAARKYLKQQNMKGLVYVSSGLGGMSGAQPKAGDICGCISVTAQINQRALNKRFNQGWVKQKFSSNQLQQLIARVKQAKLNKETVSIAYHGNIVNLWERLTKQEQNIVELGSDQTSLHNPFNGGYYPADLTFQQAQIMMKDDPEKFKSHVQASLRRQVDAINILTAKGMKFWDYGNSFLFQSKQAKANIMDNNHSNQKFRYPSYVQDIMGDIFQLGFGPFRWICTSGLHEDLVKTDTIALQVLSQIKQDSPEEIQQQLSDNIKWMKQAEGHKLIVGSQARILYADNQARFKIMKRFSEQIRNGNISAPIILSRDHHDTSSADSPYRETANIQDGSKFCADMSVQNFVGDAIRGATWVALHNGGGVGWGEVVNGGFGIVLDGRQGQIQKLQNFMLWDVCNGVGRRAWGGGKKAQWNIQRQMKLNSKLKITQNNCASEEILNQLLN